MLQLMQIGQQFRRATVGSQEMLLRHSAVCRNTIQVSIGKQSLGKGRVGDKSDSFFAAEIQDAFLFSLPYRKNWKLYVTTDDLVPEADMSTFALEISEKITEPGEIEILPEIRFEKQ